TLVSATVFLSTDPPPTAIYTLSLHDALPICDRLTVNDIWRVVLFVKTIPNHTLRKNYVPQPSDYITWQPSKELLAWVKSSQKLRSEEHTSELQSRFDLVCRLLLEKKKFI